MSRIKDAQYSYRSVNALSLLSSHRFMSLRGKAGADPGVGGGGAFEK